MGRQREAQLIALRDALPVILRAAEGELLPSEIADALGWWLVDAGARFAANPDLALWCDKCRANHPAPVHRLWPTQLINIQLYALERDGLVQRRRGRSRSGQARSWWSARPDGEDLLAELEATFAMPSRERTDG